MDQKAREDRCCRKARTKEDIKAEMDQLKKNVKELAIEFKNRLRFKSAKELNSVFVVFRSMEGAARATRAFKNNPLSLKINQRVISEENETD